MNPSKTRLTPPSPGCWRATQFILGPAVQDLEQRVAEYERLRLLEREVQQQRQKAWLELEAMMVATHNRPTVMTPE